MAPSLLLEDVPQLATARLVLRRTRVGDAPRYLQMRSRNMADPDTARFLRGAPASLEDARTRLEDIDRRFREENTLVAWTVTRPGEDELLGVVGFVRWAPDDRRSEIMYEMDPEHAGQGLVTEALPPVVAFGFEAMGMHRMEAFIDPRNTRSIRVAERLGFQREALLRDHARMGGVFVDTAIYVRFAG
jgi:ribosomal-protein-alanine N-acetyltransferase